MVNWIIIGSTFDVLGKILVGTAVLLVHRHVMKEHKIDKDVLREMKIEQLLGIFGIILIIIGYLIHVINL